MKYLKYLLFILLTFLFCQKEETKETFMLEVSQRNNDYTFILHLKDGHSKKDIPKVLQNRITKTLYIKANYPLGKEEEKKIDKGLIKGFKISDNLITIDLLRPLRYEITTLNNSFLVTLKNINSISSIEAKSAYSDKVHKESFIVDLHNDLAFQIFVNSVFLKEGTLETEADLLKLKKGFVDALFFSIWVPSDYLKGQGTDLDKSFYGKIMDSYRGKPFDFALDMIGKLKEEIYKNSSEIGFASSTHQIDGLWKQNKIAALMGLEGAHSLEADLDRLKVFYDRGIRYIGLTWSNTNEFADAIGNSKHNGLSMLGKKLILEMIKMGILIDISHASAKTFYDIIKITKHKYPIIASHSGVRSLSSHRRNLSDDIIKEIAKSNGIIGLVYHSPFLHKKEDRVKTTKKDRRRKASIEDLLDHIDYISELLGTVDNIALGSDFDGFIVSPIGLANMGELANLSLGLYNRGYSKEEISKILGKNFLRVFSFCEKQKEKAL